MPRFRPRKVSEEKGEVFFVSRVPQAKDSGHMSIDGSTRARRSFTRMHMSLSCFCIRVIRPRGCA